MILLLKLFTDVLHNNLRSKRFTYRIEPLAPVPGKTLELWRSRGYEPSGTGVAHVRFEDVRKEYTYPAYFWGE